MTTLLIHEQAYRRIETEILAVEEDLDIVLMDADGILQSKGIEVDIQSAKPDVAWISIDLMLTGQLEQYVQLVLESGTVKWLQTFHAGLDFGFYADLFGKGLRIAKSGAQAVAIAEYTIANVMAFYQGIFDRKRHQIDHKWQWTPFRELWKTRWLIVGFGNIGREIAKRVRAFDCEVVGLRRSIEGHPLADTIATLDQLDEHLPQADVVVLACPLDEKTEGLADKAFFQRMKKGAAFVNIARGKIVNQPALIEGLAEGTPGHAILDVFDPEPLPPDSPLWDMDNVIISPHSSNSGSGLVQRGDILFLENLRRFLADQPLLDEAQG